MVRVIKKSVFLPPISQAEVAQLVEHNLAKVGVASSSLVFRSLSTKYPAEQQGILFIIQHS